VRLLPDPASGAAPRIGGVVSVQEAEVTLPRAVVRELWRPEHLERLARAYWSYLRRISLGMLRIVYAPDSRTVVLLSRPLALLRFHAPEYTADGDEASVTWRIDRGLLVQHANRGRGHLRIGVSRPAARGDGADETIRVRAEVENFYPRLRGSGRYARIGAWVYGQTQGRIHVLVTRGFLRHLDRLDL
jgi:hypothetical protein